MLAVFVGYWVRLSTVVSTAFYGCLKSVLLGYTLVALICASTGKSLKCTCCGSSVYWNCVPTILKNVPTNLQQRVSFTYVFAVRCCRQKFFFVYFLLEKSGTYGFVPHVCKKICAPDTPSVSFLFLPLLRGDEKIADTSR